MYLISQSFEEDKLPITKNWYHFNYSSDKFSEEFLLKLQKPQIVDNGKKLDLPPVNSLIPTNFDVLPADAKLSAGP
jgi:secreted Zn-dependent insulinase-like peptidase